MKKHARGAINFAFILPSLTGVVVFVLWPFAGAVMRSFQDTMGEVSVGFTNYILVFENEAMRLAVGNTLRFIAVCIPLQLILSLLLAMMIRNAGRWEWLFSATFLIPMAIPVSSVAMLWRVIFAQQGFLNALIVRLGGEPQNWLNSGMTYWVLVASYLWRNVGFDMVLWRAALTGLDPTLSEAAQVDGANAWKRFLYVVLPALLPALFTITVLSLLNSFKVFREAYLIAGNYPHSDIYMLQHLFNNWFTSLDMQKLTAAAVLVALVILVLITVLQRLWERDDS